LGVLFVSGDVEMKLGAGAKSAESYFTGFLPIDVLLGWGFL
jgi:hypothetical protein